MAEIDINDVAQRGATRDEPAYMLPPEVWTTALNMRAKDNGMARVDGWGQVFGTPGVAPHFTLPIVSPSQAFWIYTSLTKGYVYDGTNHTNITRQSAGVDVDYTAGATEDWNGTLFGGIPILNNGADAPQFWGTLSPATKLANLTNWPAATTAKIIRAFGAYLMAFHVTKTGTQYPHMTKWSSESPGPGSLPASWDETDETKDAGEYDLPDVEAGVIHDALRLGSFMYIYKEQSTWSARFVGGRSVFKFDTLFDTVGILAPRCVAITGDARNHVVATSDDIIIHKGGDPASILDKRLRREIFAAIDNNSFHTSFMYTDSENSEVVFCFPESGRSYPNRALVFNYRTGAITERDGITYRNAAAGRIETPPSELWSDGTDLWSEDTGPWDLQQRRKLILCGTDAIKFYQDGSSVTRDGVAFAGTLQRTDLAVIGKKRTGEWIVNPQIMKMVDRLWPKTQGAPLQIRVGSKDTTEGAVVWGPYVAFDPSTGMTADMDPPISGRFMALEFTATGGWRIDGYRINVEADGEF